MPTPSSSPSKSGPVEVLANTAKDPEAQDDTQRATSQDSEVLWAAAGSPPRFTPPFAQFDDNEFVAYEDGEVDAEEQAPPPNQEANRVRGAESTREHADRREKVLGEHRHPLTTRDEEPTARKRSWTGSTVSEEDRRSARRPRIVMNDQPRPAMLPSINEMLGNPWRGTGGDEGRNVNFPASVTTSTPRRPPFVRKVNSFQYDEEANVSGHPPTLRGSSIDSLPGSPAAEDGSRSRTRSASRASSRASPAGMDVDPDADLEYSSLLGRPASRYGTHGAAQGTGPWNLQDAISSEETAWRGGTARDQDALWRGGYRPRDWIQEHSRARTGTGTPERGFSHFSALPNTKAWEYSRGAGGRESRDRGYEQLDFPARHASAYEGDEDEMGRRSSEDTSHALRAGRGGDESFTHGSQGPSGRRSRNATMAEWWQEPKSARIPSILMKEESVEDTPVVVDSPHSDRWTVHQSDPEEMYAGMSMEWMKAIWGDDKPSVLFTVFNYRFTKNRETNCHIETCVTSLTRQLTGETDFHVVPPDPEWRQELRPRELPYLWVIRGLSEEAAWEMVKAHVISTRGVSIITHPKTIGNPRFVCGLAGFLRPDVKTTKVAVLSILESAGMKKRLADLVRSSDRLGHLPIDKRVERVIESLDIRFMATKEDGYVANVYILPPTDDMDEWREWAEEMRACRFNVFLNGTGTARRAFWCGGCRGVDHEDQECPFTRMRGWKGPLAGEKSHSKYWGQNDQGGRKPGRGRGNSPWTPASGSRVPTTDSRRAQDGWMTPANGRGRGGGRGGHGQRGAHKNRGGYSQRGGLRSGWGPSSTTFQDPWGARY